MTKPSPLRQATVVPYKADPLTNPEEGSETAPLQHFSQANALIAEGKLKEAAEGYESALNLKPDYLEALINLSLTLRHLGQIERAEQGFAHAEALLEKRLKVHPLNADLLKALGTVLLEQEKTEQALKAYQEALNASPSADVAFNMAAALRRIGKIEEAHALLQTALTLAPASADTHIHLGALYQEMGQHENAIAAFDNALTLHPASVYAKWNKSLSLLALGNYAEGWALHETGLGIPFLRCKAAEGPRWTGSEDLRSKRLLIHCERGLGDNLQNIRYAELCKSQGASVLVSAPSPLRRLFANSPFIDAVCDEGDRPDFDFQISMMSLPFAFGTTVDTIPSHTPYLFISDAARARWADRIPPDKVFKIGLVWAGKAHEDRPEAQAIDNRRSLALTQLSPLFRIPNLRFYALQKGHESKQIETSGLEGRLIDLMRNVTDFEDTAAIVERMDLIISVDTSVAHLAGGLGKPVWILSRFDACWRWLQNRPKSPWYPTARIFGQPHPGDWQSVIQHITKALL